jgi:hypothetical protein
MARSLLLVGFIQRTWVIILKFGQIIDVIIHNDPQRIAFIVRRNVRFAKCLGHGKKERATELRWEHD